MRVRVVRPSTAELVGWKIICGVETCSGLGLGLGLDDLALDDRTLTLARTLPLALALTLSLTLTWLGSFAAGAGF